MLLIWCKYTCLLPHNKTMLQVFGLQRYHKTPWNSCRKIQTKTCPSWYRFYWNLWALYHCPICFPLFIGYPYIRLLNIYVVIVFVVVILKSRFSIKVLSLVGTTCNITALFRSLFSNSLYYLLLYRYLPYRVVICSKIDFILLKRCWCIVGFCWTL